jgi:hypothetical protein
MKRAMGIVFCLSALTPLTVNAQIIMCKDVSGRTFTSDYPIPECIDRPAREFGRNGALKREIPAPLTAEQKRQQQLDEEKRRAEEFAAAEQRQVDRAILSRYGNEGEIELAHKRTLDLVQEKVRRETAALAAAEKRYKEVQTELDLLKNKKDKKDISSAALRKLDEAEFVINRAKTKLQEYGAETAQIDSQHDATLKRYRELTRSTAAK